MARDAQLEQIARAQYSALTKSYLVPLSDLSLEDRRAMREDADLNILGAALDLKFKSSGQDLVIRDILPTTDLVVGSGLIATPATPAAEDWILPAAGVVGTESQWFSALLGVDRAMGFYGISVEATPTPISRLRLTLGANSTTVRGVFQLDQLNSRLETIGYFSETVVFVRNDTIRAMVMPRIAYAALSQRVALMGRIVEPIQNTVSAPSA